MVKLELRSDEGEVETAWAKHLGGNRYRLDNIPFFAYGISEGDVVEAEPQAKGFPLVKRVVGKSGNRTVRVFFERGSKTLPAQALLSELRKLGCSWELATESLVCMTVPPAASLDRVAAILTKTGVTWEHVDPTYEEFHPGG